MSIMTLAELRDRSAPPINHDSYCDRCGKRLSKTFVFWALGRINLAFHRQCAEEFGGTLLYEGRRAKALAQGKSPTAGIPTDMLQDLEAGGRERPVVPNKGEWIPNILTIGSF